MLAALAVHCGETVSTAYLADALWGEDPPRTAAKTLQNYVLRVRRALARAGGLAVVTLAAGYCLRVSLGSVDAGTGGEPDRGGSPGECLSGDPAAAGRPLRRALGCGGDRRWRSSLVGRSRPRKR